MAVGDITRDAGSPTIIGNKRLLTGTIEISDDPTGFQLCNTLSNIESCLVVGEDGLSVAQVQINSTDSSDARADQLGAVRVTGNDPTVRTVRYQCVYV